MRRFLLVLLMMGLAISGAHALEDLNPTEENSWEFPTSTDPWAESLVDLRHLNEDVAGQSGFIRRSEDGSEFVRGDGEPIRFWAAHGPQGTAEQLSDEDAATAARWLARMGVNMVRMGSNLNPKHEGAAITDVDEDALHTTWRAVAFYKQEGIYANISPWWGHSWPVQHIPPEWGIEGIGGDQPEGVLGAMFFDPTLQEAYRNWMRRLLTDTNPYTGIPLRDDPALAIIQIQNEDTLLFHTLHGMAAGPRRIMETQFHDWAVERYGSLEAALDAWNSDAVEGDDADAGRLGVPHPWFLTDDGRGNMNEQRARDTFRFLSEVQRAFYADMKRFIREDLGCPHLIDASNFKSADVRYMDDAERWTFTAVDTIASNDYYGATHVGDHAGYMIEPGDHFAALSATQSLRLPVGKKQVAGHPFILTETLWVPPIPYKPEGPILLAAYGAMNGIDGIFWAGPRRPTWTHGSPYRPWIPDEGQGHPFNKWDSADPAAMGTFPAAALIYRLGLVQPGPVVIREARSLDSMFAREEPVISEGFSFDPNRHTLEEAIQAEARQFDGLPFLVGRVEALYDTDPDLTEVMDLSPYIDTDTVRSATGELTMQPEPGLFTMDAPRAQGVTGFLNDAGGRFELSDVTIESGDAFASVTVVPLDGEPLAESGQVLVQVGALTRATGWRTEPATFQRGEQELEGLRIEHTGTLPWRVANTDVTVTIRNPGLTRATLLDPNGAPVGPVEVRTGEGELTIPCPPETMYIVVE